MSEQIEQRLAVAARAAREYDLCGQRNTQLRAREQAAAADLDTARQEYAGEERDVERLEHLSLTRVLAALHGSREDSLEREKAEAEAARYRVAQAAVQALADVQDRLGTAASWSTFDTYLDHGMVANAIKHDRIDQAAQAAHAADQRLAALRTDLAELGGYEPTAPRLEVSAGFKFADIFFNNIFTDLAVGHQIRDAQDNVDRSVRQVRALQVQLKDQIGTVTEQLNAMDAERRQLLAL